MFWKPASLLETNCKVDVTMYPYDFQTCAVKIGSWSYPNTAQMVIIVDTLNLLLFQKFRVQSLLCILIDFKRSAVNTLAVSFWRVGQNS